MVIGTSPIALKENCPASLRGNLLYSLPPNKFIISTCSLCQPQAVLRYATTPRGVTAVVRDEKLKVSAPKKCRSLSSKEMNKRSNPPTDKGLQSQTVGRDSYSSKPDF